MSGSTPTSSPLELTPPATSYHADDDEETSLRTPESDSDSNSGYNAGQDGYELRPLSRSGTGEDRVDYTDEHGALIAPERDSDLDDEDGSAVVYDAFRESDEEDSSELRRRRRRRPGRKEFMYTEEEERKVVRKLDLHLVGFLALLYMLSFLDRSSKFFSMKSGFCYGLLTVLRVDIGNVGPLFWNWLSTLCVADWGPCRPESRA